MGNTSFASVHAASERSLNAWTPGLLRGLVLCFLMATIDGGGLTALSFLAPQIGEALDVSLLTFGHIFSVAAIGVVIGAIIAGESADRWGRRPVVIVASFATSLCLLLTALTTTVAQMFAVRFATGVGAGALVPAAIALVAELSPPRWRAWLISFVVLGGSVGATAFALLIEVFRRVGDWHAIFAGMGLAGGLLSILLTICLPESPLFAPGTPNDGLVGRRSLSSPVVTAGAHKLFRPDLRALIPYKILAEGRARPTLLLWAFFFSLSIWNGFIAAWLPLIFVATGLSAKFGASSTSAFGMGGVTGGLIIPLLCERLGPQRTLSVSMGLGIICCAAAGATAMSSRAVNVACFFFTGAFVMSAYYLSYAVASNVYPAHLRSSGLGFASAAGRVGRVFGPLVGALLVAAGHSAAVVLLASTVPLVIAFAAMLALTTPWVQQSERPVPDHRDM